MVSGKYFLYHVIQKHSGIECMFKRTCNINISSSKEHVKPRGKIFFLFQAAEAATSCYNIMQIELSP